jgi:hypothetical protein
MLWEESVIGLREGQILMHRDTGDLYYLYDIWEDSRGFVMEARNLMQKEDTHEIIRADLKDYILGGCA